MIRAAFFVRRLQNKWMRRRGIFSQHFCTIRNRGFENPRIGALIFKNAVCTILFSDRAAGTPEGMAKTTAEGGAFIDG